MNNVRKYKQRRNLEPFFPDSEISGTLLNSSRRALETPALRPVRSYPKTEHG